MIKFYKKLLDVYGIKLIGNNWIISKISWLINSKYHTYTRLDKWIESEYQNSNLELYELAEELRDKNPDKTVVNITKWVQKNVKYKSDTYEEWKGCNKTFKDKFGDCDDMNCLVYVLCRLAGISQYQLFCAIGDMTKGGHFFPLYYSTKEEKMVSIDSTYYPRTVSVSVRQDFNSLSYHKTIWYLFNRDICIKPIS